MILKTFKNQIKFKKKKVYNNLKKKIKIQIKLKKKKAYSKFKKILIYKM